MKCPSTNFYWLRALVVKRWQLTTFGWSAIFWQYLLSLTITLSYHYSLLPLLSLTITLSYHYSLNLMVVYCAHSVWHRILFSDFLISCNGCVVCYSQHITCMLQPSAAGALITWFFKTIYANVSNFCIYFCNTFNGLMNSKKKLDKLLVIIVSFTLYLLMHVCHHELL